MYEKMDADTAKKVNEADNLRKIAFIGVTLSTVAVLASVIAVPMLYNYLQHVQSVLQNEVDFCRSKSGSLWAEFDRTQDSVGVNNVRRSKRHTSYYSQQPSYSVSYQPQQRYQPSYGNRYTSVNYQPAPAPYVPSLPVMAPPVQVSGSCCSCGSGPAGPPGSPGSNGRDGNDGSPGQDGAPGSDAVQGQLNQDWCFDCAPAQAGPAGSPGQPGQRGRNGSPGQDGANGNPGADGNAGPAGPAGQPGIPGRQGSPGQPGQIIDQVGASGPAGAPGPSGQPGSDGMPGRDGNPGGPGQQGPQGDNGSPGRPGNNGMPGGPGRDGGQGSSGGCDHCPPPRTAPGYRI